MEGKVIPIYKKQGQTPLECLNDLKIINPEWKHLPMTYAGRLDPLAEGMLIILAGDECLNKDTYLSMPKEYELTVLFGFATDTYDLLGKVETQFVNNISLSGEDISSPDFDFKESLSRFIGRIRQAYPPYSSRPVDGKPLYKWAREGKLGEIQIPAHDVFIESIEILKRNSIKREDLNKKIIEAIPKVNGDFRQIEIMKDWEEVLIAIDQDEFPILTLRIACGSGVYVRTIAHELGIAIGIPSLAYKIVRTKVGNFDISNFENKD